jgi:hydrogenase maturation protease
VTGRVLVAGIGNIFLGDDGFGAEVARRLAEAGLPEGVQVADYGISGMHLAYDLAEGCDLAILIDAAPRGGEPGTITVLEVGRDARRDLAAIGAPLQSSRFFDGHGMNPEVVFGVLGMLGADPGRVLVVGCEPASVEPGIGLSGPVQAAVGEAVRIVRDLIAAGPGPACEAGGSAAGKQTTGEEVSHVPRHSG